MTVGLSVVIPTYQRRESLGVVLAALAAQEKLDASFEVIVSVDGGTDGTAAMVAAAQAAGGMPYRLRLVAGGNAGPAAARNRGAAQAEAPLLLFLDDDIVASPGLLAAHVDGHAAGQGRQVGLGQVRTQAAGSLSPWERYLTDRFEEHYDKLGEPEYAPTFWDCLSGNFSLARALWQESGGFDASFGLTRHEDIEFGYRLQQQGVTFVYLPVALGFHRFVKSTGAGLRDARAEGRSARRLAQRHPALAPRLLQARQARYPRVVRGTLRHSLQHPRGHALVARLVGGLLQGTSRWALPLALRQLLFRAAFHLHFWWGVLEEGPLDGSAG
jgi:GT2 family glycosyltransferase